MPKDCFLVILSVMVFLISIFLKHIEKSANPIKEAGLNAILYFGVFLLFISFILLFLLSEELIKDVKHKNSIKTRKKR